MIKNVNLNEFRNSNLSREFKNITIENFTYNYLYSDFIIDSKFFPISIKSYETSFELFKSYTIDKYNIYFTEKYFDFINKNLNKFILFDKAFVIGSSDNYYHLLIDFLPRLFSINNLISNKIDKIVFSNKNIKKNNIIFSLIKELKINKRIIFLEKGNYLFKNSFIPININLKSKIYFYKKLLSRHLIYKSNNNIYVTRKDSNTRGIVNENEIINFLKKHNFKIVELSKFDFYNQVEMFNKAKVIIGMHGAGLANTMFCNKKTLIIELVADFSGKNEDWFTSVNQLIDKKFIRNHFINISKINKLSHFLYFCSSNDNAKILKNDQMLDLTYTNIKIDLDIFSSFFSKIFNSDMY